MAREELGRRECPHQMSTDNQPECYVCGLGVMRNLRKTCDFWKYYEYYISSHTSRKDISIEKEADHD